MGLQIVRESGSGKSLVTLRAEKDGAYLGEESVAELGNCVFLNYLDSQSSHLVFRGSADQFLLGIDPQWFLKALRNSDLDRILKFTRSAQEVLKQIERSGKPTLAWLEGLAYGAGVELALACERIVAAPGAKFSFPETGLGIYPGMGGTQRAPRRIGVGLAKWMIFCGAIVPSQTAWEIGLVDALCPAGATVDEVIAAARRPSTPRPPLSPRLQALEDLFARHNVDELLDAKFPAPEDPQAHRALIQMRGKAPVALRLAEAVIDRGVKLSLDEGLELEFAGLSEVFATEDARAGLAASGGQRPPKFVGR